MSQQIEVNTSISGISLNITRNSLHSAIYNLQYCTLEHCTHYGVDREAVISAIAAVKKQWGNGYPGRPQWVVFHTIAANPPVLSVRYFAAGVFFIADMAARLAEDGNCFEAGRYFQEAGEVYSYLRIDTGELFHEYKKQMAKSAAMARHSAPGGSHDKAESIKRIWASGKYSSRDICAEQECAALNMSFSSARKALRNTPSPTA